MLNRNCAINQITPIIVFLTKTRQKLMSYTFLYIEVFHVCSVSLGALFILKIITIDKDDLFRCGSPLIVDIHICLDK